MTDDQRWTCHPNNFSKEGTHFFSGPKVALPWYKQTPHWKAKWSCECGEQTSRTDYRDFNFLRYARLPVRVQIVLCKIRFPRGCPHIIPGGRWSGR